MHISKLGIPLLFICIHVFISSCEFFGLDSKPKDPLYDPHNTPTCRYINFDHDTKTGIRIMYYESGKKKSYGYFTNGMRDSLFRSWYENGNKRLRIWYDKGMKQGLYQYYRKTGELYKEIEYKDDLKHGEYKEFWKNGRVKYVLNYENDFSQDWTLKEYKSSGKVKAHYLVIDERNTVKTDGMYRLYVYFPELPKEAIYLVHVDGMKEILQKKNGKGVLEIELPYGYSLMKKVMFEGFYEGRKNTVQSIKRSFNIGVDSY